MQARQHADNRGPVLRGVLVAPVRGLRVDVREGGHAVVRREPLDKRAAQRGQRRHHELEPRRGQPRGGGHRGDQVRRDGGAPARIVVVLIRVLHGDEPPLPVSCPSAVQW